MHKKKITSYFVLQYWNTAHVWLAVTMILRFLYSANMKVHTAQLAHTDTHHLVGEVKTCLQAESTIISSEVMINLIWRHQLMHCVSDSVCPWTIRGGPEQLVPRIFHTCRQSQMMTNWQLSLFRPPHLSMNWHGTLDLSPLLRRWSSQCVHCTKNLSYWKYDQQVTDVPQQSQWVERSRSCWSA